MIVVVHPPKIRRTLRAGPPGFTHFRIAHRDMKAKSPSKQNQLGWGILTMAARATSPVIIVPFPETLGWRGFEECA